MGERLDELKGDLKEGWGKATGNERLQGEGEAQHDSARAERKIEGGVQQVGGSVKEGLGKLTGDRSTEMGGTGDRLGGEAKSAG